MCLISVIIPTYNRIPLLHNAVDSVINQTYSNIEIIIVDNGDLPYEKYIDLLALSDKIKYIKIPEHGANYARNKGISVSNGEYVAFLDDDDEWLPTKLEESLNLFRQNADIGLVFTDKIVIYPDERISYYSHSNFHGDSQKEILLTNFIGTTSCVMVKRHLLHYNNFDVNMPAYQDHDLWIRLCQLCKVGYLEKPLLKYYQRSSLEQISSDYTKYIAACKIMDKKYSTLFASLSEDERKTINIYRINGLLLKALRSQDSKGFWHLLHAQPIEIKIRGIIEWVVGYKGMLRIKSIIHK